MFNCLILATSSVTAHVVRVAGLDRPTIHNANSGRFNHSDLWLIFPTAQWVICVAFFLPRV